MQGERNNEGNILLIPSGSPVKPWIKRLARFGFAAKGFVYIMIGVLAVQVALGLREETTGARGALAVVVEQPVGQLLLGVVAVGLSGHVVWRLVQATLDPADEGTDLKGIAKRAGYALSGAVYALLAFAAIRLTLGATTGGNDDRAQDWTTRVLDWPLGTWLVAMAGVIVMGMGANALYGAYSARFREKFQPEVLTGKTGVWVRWAGRTGLAARGIVFGLIGVFLIRAALESNPRRVRDLDGALHVLGRQPYGTGMLCLVAAGLVAYGGYLFVEARFRRIP